MPKNSKKKKSQKKTPAASAPLPVAHTSYFYSNLRFIVILLCFMLSAYMTIAFLTPWGGVVGSSLRQGVLEWFGLASYFCVLFPVMTAVFLVDPERKPSWLHLAYLFAWFLSIVLFFGMLQMSGKSAFLALFLIHFFGKGGTFILSLTFLIGASLLITKVPFQFFVNAWKFLLGIIIKIFQTPRRPFVLPTIEPAKEVDTAVPVMIEPVIDELAAEIPIKTEELPKEPVEEIDEEESILEEDDEFPEEEELPKVIEAPPVVKKEEPLKKQTKMTQQALPSLNLLEDADSKGEKGLRIEPSDYSHLLEETLRNFGVEATVVHVERGPTVTRYELQPAKGVKVSKIVSLSDDLALALAATSLRIEAPIPGKSAIGIEVPNSSVAMVYFKDLLASKIYRESPLKMMLALGKDIAGQPVFTDLKRMPHLLIAGATGSGKTVCINTLIASILFKATPDEVQFIMIDPKRVELTIYDGIPHLIQEVVTDPKQASKVLMDVLAIMDERYNLFKASRVRNLEEYNKAHSDAPLPFIVVLIDELADLMMLAAATVETSISRLAALARAAGIHLIVATQRPSVDVITGIIKANIPSRISFAVSSMVDSRTILDTGGAEKLLGRGDMLFAPIDAMKPLRLQGAYVGLSEIEALVSFWCKQPAPQNRVQFPVHSMEAEVEEEQNDEDELYAQAKEIILRTNQASVSTLQRKLKIGYARAGRLMDILEKKGVVGPADGAKPRKILIQNPFQPSS